MNRRNAVIILPVLMLVLLAGLFKAGNKVYAVNENNARYYYDQLTQGSRRIYDAIDQMNTLGIFKTGTEDYDLAANGYVTLTQMKDYQNGSQELLSLLDSAKTAFCSDHSDVFYVDFAKLSIRVTTDSSGNYHAYLGAGSRENYYTEGFTGKEQTEKAISEYEAKISQIAAAAGNVSIKAGQDLTSEQIKYVYDYILQHTRYCTEDTCSPGNRGYVGTSYGALVKGEGAAEAYSKALKAVLDRLGIPCILAWGVYGQDAGTLRVHTWNYVWMQEAWHGMDGAAADGMTGGNGGSFSDEAADWKDAVWACLGEGYVRSRFAAPAFYENTEFSLAGWTADEGEAVSDLLKNRAAVIVSPSGQTLTESADRLIAQNGAGIQVLAREVYDVSFSVENRQIAKTGGVRISLGFPSGYPAADPEASYKIYRLEKDNSGSIIRVTEVKCAVTQYGLVMSCNSPGTFAVAAVKGGSVPQTARTVLISGTEGGTISGENFFVLSEGESKTVTFNAEEGYVLESLDFAGFNLPVSDGKSMSVRIEYKNLKNGTNVIDARFVSESVMKKETDRGEVPVLPSATLPENRVEDPRKPQTTPTPAPAQTPVPSPASSSAPAQVPGAVVPTDTSSAGADGNGGVSGNGGTSGNSGSSGSVGNTGQDTAQPAMPPVSVPVRTSSGTVVRGKTPVMPAVITVTEKELTVLSGDVLTIIPELQQSVGIHVYQWYKDGAPLAEQKSKTLTIEKATIQDAGSYTLEVTTSLGSESVQAVSDACIVKVYEAKQGGSEDEKTESSDTHTPTPPDTVITTDTFSTSVGFSQGASDGSETAQERENNNAILLVTLILILGMAAFGIAFFVIRSQNEYLDD